MSIKNEDIINAISKMNLLEIMELTKALEEKFNIKATTFSNEVKTAEHVEEPIVKEEKTTFTVIMTDFGTNKIDVIKTMRTILNLGIKEAKDFVENIPAIIKENIEKDEAEKIKSKLETSGAKIELK